ncbi:uncharacterized protein PAC_00461 [Phialocephala subalpina]|uniref:Uncharacterized protein n=1 Tax=Phialocephala subalpina TaxID=576137 RepID=A0A1L7WCU3_9HELO|nr:uncharacterized protein PAC_00461 [Phialocephala subalpina]
MADASHICKSSLTAALPRLSSSVPILRAVFLPNDCKWNNIESVGWHAIYRTASQPAAGNDSDWGPRCRSDLTTTSTNICIRNSIQSACFDTERKRDARLYNYYHWFWGNRSLTLILCQLEGDPSEQISQSNSYKVLGVEQNMHICKQYKESMWGQQIPLSAAAPANFFIWLDQTPASPNTSVSLTLANLFFCIGPYSGTNDVYSFYSDPSSFGSDGKPTFGEAVFSSAVPATMTIISAQATLVLSLHATSTGIATITHAYPVVPSTGEAPSAPSSSTGLSPGTKAGIAVGAVLLLLLMLFVAWRIIVRRKRRRREEGDENGMSTKQNFPEMDEQNQGKGAIPQPPAIVKPVREVVDIHGLSPEANELSTSSPGQAFVPTQELETRDQTIEIQQEAPPVKEEDGGKERKLKILRDRIDRIRIEKERLERIQELKDLEEQTKREILDAQR